MFQSPQPYSPYGNSFGMGSYGSSFGMNPYGMGGGGMGFNSFGGYGGGFRQGFGNNPLDPETRFIQLAEESSRSAFQSIEQVVSTIGNIATMLDSTYFALTSSFRAILGLAANFSQMRGFLSKFFSTFTIFRTIVWIYKKLLYMMGLSKSNPATAINLNEAFKDAEQVNAKDFFHTSTQQNSSGLPMVLFLAFVFSAPYLIMKLFGSLINTAADQSEFKHQNFCAKFVNFSFFKQPKIHQHGKMLLMQRSCTTSTVRISRS
jgi:peroxin-13